MRNIVSDGTNLYIANDNGINKIVVTTGAQSTLGSTLAHALGKSFVSLTYGNSILFGADQDAVYSINTTTGVLTEIAKIADIDSIMYHSPSQLIVLAGNTANVVTIIGGVSTLIPDATDL